MLRLEGGLRTKESSSKAKDYPLVSIISVVFNGVANIEDTILSVKEKLSEEIEYIIIDGSSSDGTLDVIQNHEDSIDYWLSENDQGIYDAINKGIKASKGYFFFVLNIGDKLLDFPYAELRQARQTNADVVLFDVLLSNNRIVKSKIDYRSRFGNTIHHQGAFYRRSLDIEYDLSFKVYSDFDTNQKLLIGHRKFLRFEKIVSYHSLDGISNERKHRHEYFAVIRKNFGLFWMVIGIVYIWQGEMRMKLKNLLSSTATSNHGTK